MNKLKKEKVSLKKKGFTLVELLVSISILVILAGISLVSFRGTRAVSRDTERKTELELVRSALEIYRTDNGVYPTTAEGLALLLGGGYVDLVPVDPLTPTYQYEYSSDGLVYTLCAYLETRTGTVIGCGGDCGDECRYKVENP
ncbi:type II secretion system protein [Patescibacteria group bacterium]